MKIVRFDELKEFQTSEGIIKPLFASEGLNMVHLKIPAGLKEHPHAHTSPENLLVLRGSVRLNAENPVVLQKGDMAHIPADYTVGLESEDEAEALLISSPLEAQQRGEIRTKILPAVQFTVRSIRSHELSPQLCNLQVCNKG